jgi:hypothetical protein
MITAEEAKKAIDHTNELFFTIQSLDDAAENNPKLDANTVDFLQMELGDMEHTRDEPNPADILRAYIEETETALKAAVDEIDALRAESIRLKSAQNRTKQTPNGYKPGHPILFIDDFNYMQKEDDSILAYETAAELWESNYFAPIGFYCKNGGEIYFVEITMKGHRRTHED